MDNEDENKDILDAVGDIEFYIEQITWHRQMIANELISMNRLKLLLGELGETLPNEWLCSHGARWDKCPDCSH